MATYSGLQGWARTTGRNDSILTSNSVMYLQDACSVVRPKLRMEYVGHYTEQRSPTSAGIYKLEHAIASRRVIVATHMQRCSLSHLLSPDWHRLSSSVDWSMAAHLQSSKPHMLASKASRM